MQDLNNTEPLPAHPATPPAQLRALSLPRHGKARRWLPLATVIACTAGLCIAFSYGSAALLSVTEQPRAIACGEALSYIGWELPAQSRDHQCTKEPSTFASHMYGSFRMPREDAHAWLVSLPGERNHIPAAGSDGVLVSDDGLELSIGKARYPQVDAATVSVRYEDRDSVLVTFDTLDM